MISERLQSRPVKIVGGVALLVAAGIIGLYLTFPSGMVSRVIEAQLIKALGPGWTVQVTSARPAGLSAVTLKGITISAPQAGVPVGPPPLPTRIDSLNLKVSLFSLLKQAPQIRVRLRADEGRADISVTLAKDRVDGSAEFNELPLQRLAILSKWTHLPPMGRLSGDLSFRFDEDGHPVRLSSDLSIDTLVLGEGVIQSSALAQVGGFVPLPTTHFGATKLILSLEDRTLRIETFETLGNDIRLSMDGVADLSRPISSSRLRLRVRFSPSEDYIERAALGGIMDMVPVFREAQTADGYGFLFQGTIGSPGTPQPLGP